MVCNTEFFVHDYVFRDLFPLQRTRGTRKFAIDFEDASIEAFDAILAFMYFGSEDAMWMLGSRYFDVLKDLAVQEKSFRLLEGVLRAFYTGDSLSDEYLALIALIYNQGQASKNFQDWVLTALRHSLENRGDWEVYVPDAVVLRWIKHFGTVPELLDACIKAVEWSISDEQRSALESRKQQALDTQEKKSDKGLVGSKASMPGYDRYAHAEPQVVCSPGSQLGNTSTANNGNGHCTAYEGFGDLKANCNCETPKDPPLIPYASEWDRPSTFQPAVLKTPVICPRSPIVPVSVVPSRQPTVPPTRLHEQKVGRLGKHASWVESREATRNSKRPGLLVPTPVSTPAQPDGTHGLGMKNLPFLQRAILLWLQVNHKATLSRVADGVGCFEIEASEALKFLEKATCVCVLPVSWGAGPYYSLTVHAYRCVLPWLTSMGATARQEEY